MINNSNMKETILGLDYTREEIYEYATKQGWANWKEIDTNNLEKDLPELKNIKTNTVGLLSHSPHFIVLTLKNKNEYVFQMTLKKKNGLEIYQRIN